MQTLELTTSELESIEGGVIPLIIIGAALLVSSCGNNQTNNNESGSQAVNVNCSNCTVIISSCDSTSVKVVQN